ncbi:VWA domain-containing protein, partial [Shimia litoralis]
PWAVRVSRILSAQDGTAQWYPDTARIVPEVRIEGTAIYIAMDASGSMSGSRMGAQITAVSRLIDEIGKNNLARENASPNDIQILTYAAEVQSTILRRNADSTAYSELSDWLEGLSSFTNGGTDFGAAVSEAEAFFEGASSKRRVLIFVTDGEPSPTSSVNAAKATLAHIADLDVYAFNIALPNTAYTAEIDNTPVDGVPIVPEGDPDALVASFRSGFGRDPDMNPAHIIRECLTNEDWGLGYSTADIGPSFAVAADTLFAESFGLSLLWQRESAIEDFIADVLSHIDAYLYINRRSGRWELRLIRDDYDPETIPVFDDSNIVDWGELGRREASDLINALTLRFTDIRTDQTGTVSVSDTGLVQEFGQVISTTLDYPGIRHEALASRVAARDLQALSAPLLSGEITVTRAGADLDPGDVIALTSPERGLSHVIMRVAEMDLGDGRKNGIGLKLVEDVFALSSTAFVGGESSETGALIVPPKPLARRWVSEAPYWLLVQELGHTQADARLEEDADAGALVAIAERPSPDALSAQVWHDMGSGYEPLEPVEFAPTALLGEDLSEDPEQRQVAVGAWQGLEDVPIGTLASIDEELLRIDGVSPTTLTLGRGCLDTMPQSHVAGTPVIFWQALANATDPVFGAGEVLSVKLLPETGFGTLPLAQASEDQITMASRAIRPLPPGDVRANGQLMADINALNDGPLQLTWAHRDRLSQTSQIIDAHDAASIGPEPGVFYHLELRWVDPDTDTALEPPAKVLEAGTGTSFVFLKEEIPTDQAPPLTKHIEISLRAHRITGAISYGAWQARPMRFYMPDGLKLSGAEMWLGFGTGADLEARVVEAWADHSDLEPQNILGAESFAEHATTKAVSADRISIYIEVEP